MSDDLISRKALIGTERLLMTDVIKNNPAAKFVLEQVLFDIEHADTAFDKEKVVKELQKCAEEARKYWQKHDCEDMHGLFRGYKNAVDIVENGGLN